MGPSELKCIESWRKYFPDYEIVRWDESNFDVHCCPYVSQAYDAKKWAFVSDYARFAILYKHGGLYFDTDVEVVRPMDDIIEKGPFMGFETDASGSEGNCTVAPGLGLSANPGLGLYELILASYEADRFINDDGTLNLTTVVVRTTEILRSRGLQDVPGIQEVSGVTIYPSEYFNPKSYLTGAINITENTRSIHHFSMSWFNEEQRFKYRVEVWLRNHGVNGRLVYKLAAVANAVRSGDRSLLQ